VTVVGRPGPQGPGLTKAIASWFGGRPFSQCGMLLGAVAIFGLFGNTMLGNMHRFGIVPGFAFLNHAANFEIGESLISYSSRDSYARAILVGLLNTIQVAIFGCILATVLGVALGVARLSGNRLLSGLAQVYVEVVRNTPLLLQLFFWNATIHALPGPREALQPVDGFLLSNRGVFLPALRDPSGQGWLFPGMLAGLLLLLGLAWLRRRRRQGPSLRYAIGVLAISVLVPAGVALGSGSRVRIELPALHGFNITGGMSVSQEFVALLVALVVNAAAGICEIVRGGIQAIPPGQWDAAAALGLTRWGSLRLVILPQALRVIIPLMTSSYLSLTKNSSLAVAIGFPDLVSVVNTGANQTGQVFETITIMMTVYLTLSLFVSVAMNLYNRRLALQGYAR